MQATASDQTMAKKKPTTDGGGPSGEQPGKKTTMKVEPGLLRKARMVSLYKDVDLFDYIDGIIRPVVERDYAQMIRREARED